MEFSEVMFLVSLLPSAKVAGTVDRTPSHVYGKEGEREG